MSRKPLIVTAAAATAVGAAALVGFAGAANAATTSSTATPSAPSAAAATCDRTPWEATVEGQPSLFKAGAPLGDYLWHDKNGFHLRVTHANQDRRVVSGVVTSSAALRVDPVKLEKGDVLKLSADHRSFVFDFENYGGIDGVDFHTDCAGSLTVSDLRVGNDNLPTGDVYLGAKDEHPARVPFTVHRLPVPSSASPASS